jgi:hypothetical protein
LLCYAPCYAARRPSTHSSREWLRCAPDVHRPHARELSLRGARARRPVSTHHRAHQRAAQRGSTGGAPSPVARCLQLALRCEDGMHIRLVYQLTALVSPTPPPTPSFAPARHMSCGICLEHSQIFLVQRIFFRRSIAKSTVVDKNYCNLYSPSSARKAQHSAHSSSLLARTRGAERHCIATHESTTTGTSTAAFVTPPHHAPPTHPRGSQCEVVHSHPRALTPRMATRLLVRRRARRP